MTVKEAMYELQERLDLIKDDFREDPTLRSYAEALTMAIEALKATDEPDEPDNDNIDADIQAADMAAEDMEDNTEEDWP